MGLNHFVMNTKGYCLFCLKISKSIKSENQSVNQVISDNDDQLVPTVFSLQRLCHYLRLNRKKIFNDVISVSPASLPVLEKSELKGVLCEECSKLNATISDLSLEMEILQMTLDSCLFKIHDKINGIEKDAKLKEEFKVEMLNNPQTLLHVGIVEQLQKEVLSKCSSLIGKAQPQVMLKRRDTLNPAIPELIIRQPPSYETTNSSSVASECEQLGESTPIILSVQGSYHGDTASTPIPILCLSKDNAIKMETDSWKIHIEHESQTENPMVDPLSDPVDTMLGPPNTSSRQCRFCPKSFRTHWLKRDHERAIHQGVKFSCGFCPATFTIRSSVHRHRRKFHKSERRPFKIKVEPSTATPAIPACRICHKTFKNDNIRKRHEKIHLGLGPQYSCDLCPGKFTRKDNMLDHRQQVHKEIIGKTDMNKAANNESSASLGIEPITPKCDIRFECKICFRKFRRNCEVEDHQKTVHQGLRFHCGFCPATFLYRATAKLHQKKFHKEELVQQLLLPNKKNNFQLKMPKRGGPLRSSGVDFPTPSTPLKTTSSLLGISRPKQHSQVLKRFVCRTCPKAFSTSGVRLKHERSTHQGVRFQCTVCPLVYTLMSNLSRHKKKMHSQGGKPKASASALQFKIGNSERIELHNRETEHLPNFLPEDDQADDNPEDGSGPDSCECQHCNKRFKSVPSLKQHLTMVHNLRENERKYECEYCGKRFIRNNILTEHRRSVHLGRKYSCPLCPQEFTQAGSMRNHMRKTCPNRPR